MYPAHKRSRSVARAFDNIPDYSIHIMLMDKDLPESDFTNSKTGTRRIVPVHSFWRDMPKEKQAKGLEAIKNLPDDVVYLIKQFWQHHNVQFSVFNRHTDEAWGEVLYNTRNTGIFATSFAISEYLYYQESLGIEKPALFSALANVAVIAPIWPAPNKGIEDKSKGDYIESMSEVLMIENKK